MTSFYSLQTFVMPVLIVVFMLMYFTLIRKQGSEESMDALLT